MESKHVAPLILGCAILLYIASLFLPGLTQTEYMSASNVQEICGHAQDAASCFVKNQAPASDPSPMYGYVVLLMGWVGIFMLQFAWYANAAFLLSLIFDRTKERLSAVITSGIAIVLGAQALLTFHAYPADEAGVMEMRVNSFDIGYYLWLLSLVLMLVYTIMRYRTATSAYNPSR